MVFTLVHADGRRTANPPLAAVAALLAEPRGSGGPVEIQHREGWTLRMHRDGRVVLVNVRAPEVPARHLTGVPAGALLELAEAIAVGSFYETLEHPWREGSG